MALRRHIIRLRLIVAAALALACIVCGALAASPQSAKLTILYTNDIHGHLFPFDYADLGGQFSDVGGAARRATLIRGIKAKSNNPVLVLDAGDVFVRGPLDNLEGVPDFAVMNAVPYDAMTPGNNEFKGAPGPEAVQVFLERAKQARFAVVSANVFDKASGERLLPAYKIFELGGLKVAVLGLLAGRDGKSAQYQNLRIDDPIAVARQYVPELRKQADIVIALTHLGLPGDLELASSVQGIDAIIGGDSHTWLYQPLLVSRPDATASDAVGGTLVCQDGEWGRCLGRLDLDLRSVDGHGYLVSSYSGKLVSVDSSVAPAADIAAIIDKAAAPYSTVIGENASEVKLSQGAEWVAESMRKAAGSQIGVEPREQIVQGLHAGKVTSLDVRSMFAFVNHLVSLVVTKKQLTDFLRLQPESALAGARLVNGELYVGTKKADDSRNYTLCIEDYYAAHSPSLIACPSIPLGKTNVDVVSELIHAHPHCSQRG